MATDYDCWHTGHESVTADLVTQNLAKNVQKAKDTVVTLVGLIPDTYESPSASALQSAIMTRLDLVPGEVLEKMRPLLGRYL
jgi:5'-methylthioadenosine phosphorylase